MTRSPMAVPLAASIGAWLVGAALGCAGSAPKTAAPTTAITTTPPAGSSALAPVTSPSASVTAGALAPVSPAGSGVAAGSISPAASSAPAAPPDPAAAAPANATPPAASATLAPLPVPATPPPAPAAAPRVLLADELPYSLAHLRAHDSKAEHAEHHRSRERETAGTRSLDHDRAGKRPYHPAPGIIVDVIAADGGSSAPDLQRAARNLAYWPFRQCYEEGLRRDPHLSGKVSLELAISPAGSVDRSVVTASTQRDEIVAACVAREAQHLALPAGATATTAKVDVSLALGDEPVPAGRAIPGAEAVREALRGPWDAVRRCYTTALASHPRIGGRMELHFRMKHGEIVEVSEMSGASDSERFGDVDVTRCVLGIYRTTRLPAHGAHERSFVYALQFESAPVVDAAP